MNLKPAHLEMGMNDRTLNHARIPKRMTKEETRMDEKAKPFAHFARSDPLKGLASCANRYLARPIREVRQGIPSPEKTAWSRNPDTGRSSVD